MTTTVLVMTNLESWMRQLIHERLKILLRLIHELYYYFLPEPAVLSPAI